MNISHSKKLARVALYSEQLRRMPARGIIYFAFGGDSRRALQTLISGDAGNGDYYVYVHRGPDDSVFYVGKGRGNRAYSKDREDIWHHYVSTRCEGQYEVEIVKRFETDNEALEFENDLIALFGEHTVNALNTARKIDYEVNTRFHKLRKANWAQIAAATSMLEIEPEAAESAFRKAIQDIAEYARLNWEQGLFAELASEVYGGWSCHINASDLAALDKLTILLKSQGRWVELIEITDKFFDIFPETRSQGLAERVIKRSQVARAKVIKQGAPPWAQSHHA